MWVIGLILGNDEIKLGAGMALPLVRGDLSLLTTYVPSWWLARRPLGSRYIAPWVNQRGRWQFDTLQPG